MVALLPLPDTMLTHDDFAIRHVQERDLDALLPLLNDLDLRANFERGQHVDMHVYALLRSEAGA